MTNRVYSSASSAASWPPPCIPPAHLRPRNPADFRLNKCLSFADDQWHLGAFGDLVDVDVGSPLDIEVLPDNLRPGNGIRQRHQNLYHTQYYDVNGMWTISSLTAKKTQLFWCGTMAILQELIMTNPLFKSPENGHVEIPRRVTCAQYEHQIVTLCQSIHLDQQLRLHPVTALEQPIFMPMLEPNALRLREDGSARGSVRQWGDNAC